MTGPLHDGGDRAVVVAGRRHAHDVQPRVDDDRVASIALTEVVLAGYDFQTGRLHVECRGVVNGHCDVVSRCLIPIVVDAECGVGSVVVVSGADHNLCHVAHLRTHQSPCTTFDFSRVSSKDHVDVNGDHHDQRVAARQCERRGAKVIVHPRGVVVAVADVHLPLVPFGNEDTNVVRVATRPPRRIEQVGTLRVDGRHNAGARSSRVQYRRGGFRRRRRSRAAFAGRSGRVCNRLIGDGRRLSGRRLISRTRRDRQRCHRDCGEELLHGASPWFRYT